MDYALLCCFGLTTTVSLINDCWIDPSINLEWSTWKQANDVQVHLQPLLQFQKKKTSNRLLLVRFVILSSKNSIPMFLAFSNVTECKVLRIGVSWRSSVHIARNLNWKPWTTWIVNTWLWMLFIQNGTKDHGWQVGQFLRRVHTCSKTFLQDEQTV